MRRRFTPTLLLAGLLSVACPSADVSAQVEIPREIVTRARLSPEDVKLVQDFVKERMPLLANADPAVMKKARDELLSSFKSQQVAVAFRQEFDRAAMPELRTLAGHAQDVVVVNALRVAAELATTDASILLEQKLADSKVAIRFAAVNGLERTMTALSTRSPAIPAQRVEQIVERLGNVVTDAANAPEIVDAGVRALIAARMVSVGNTRVLAVRTLSSSVGKVAVRFKRTATPLPMQLVFLRAGQATRDGLGNIQLALGTESVRDSAELSGLLLGWSFCQLNSGNMPGAADREAAAQIINVAETTVVVACQRLGTPVEPQKLSSDFEKAVRQNDNAFVQNIVKIISPLRLEPFNLAGNDFLNCK